MSYAPSLSKHLLDKYNINAPRYTSYPTALQFAGFSATQARQALTHLRPEASSLYVHIPFCHSLCYYCGCNKVVTPHTHKADKYLDYLAQEAALLKPLVKDVPFRALHLGGGSPSFLSLSQQQQLSQLLTETFNCLPTMEKSIEIDPRKVDAEYLHGLAALGFQRLSIGVQDVNAQVQTAINRVQSTSHISSLVSAARASGFRSINLDLIYGLPHQTLDSFKDTLAAVTLMRPDRVSLFSYAHLPEKFAAQRRINNTWLPDASSKSALMQLAQQALLAQGYIMIGMDHFALPQDTLALAKKAQRLFRNFQGYTHNDEAQLLGLGVSAISQLDTAIMQNHKTLSDYYAAIEQQQLPVSSGINRSLDDRIRGFVISQLMCNMTIVFDELAQRFGIDPQQYLATELAALQPLVADKLVHLSPNGIKVDESARLLVRVICSVFDAYLTEPQQHRGYSRVI